MWFVFPRGAERITIERQEFASEIVDETGNHYFRAPDVFAPRILALNGFSLAKDIPEGAPADLPKEDPKRDQVIEQLATSLQAAQAEIQNLRADLNALNHQHEAEVLAHGADKALLEAARARVAELEEIIESNVPAAEVVSLRAGVGKK